MPLSTAHAGESCVATSGRPELAEAFLRLCCEYLHTAAPQAMAEPVRTWLARRGIDRSMAIRLPLGLLFDCAQMRSALARQGFTKEEIRASELAADPRLPGRLMGPVRDADGNIVTFWALDVQDRRPRLLFHRAWKHRVPAVGLEVALPALSGKTAPLVLVEEIVDAMLLHGTGFARAAAVGGSFAEMTTQRWEALARLGVGSVALVLLPRPETAGTLERALDQAYQATAAPSVQVLFSWQKGPRRTLNEWFQRRGPQALEAAIDRRALPGYTAKARLMLDRHRPAAGWDDHARRAAWAEAVRFYQARLAFGVEPLERWFVPPVASELAIAWDLARFRPADTEPRPAAANQDPSATPPQTPQDAEPATVQSQAQSPQEAPRPSPAPQPPTATSLRYCPLHHCDHLACFCFD